jgi:amino acid transporter
MERSMAGSETQADPAIGYWSAVSIGIGGMVGGGIFAVLGLAAQLGGGGTPLSFAFAGLVALLSSYSFARLSVTFPSRGGTVEFLNRAFGQGVFSGGLNVLLILSYIVMLSLYAVAFGSYGASFFLGSSQLLWKHIFISSAVLSLTGLNVAGAAVVGRFEDLERELPPPGAGHVAQPAGARCRRHGHLPSLRGL